MDTCQETEPLKVVQQKQKLQIVWPNVIVFIIYHFLALQGVIYTLTLAAHWKTVLYGISKQLC